MVARRRFDNSVEGDENNFSWQAQILIGCSSRRASCPVPSNSFFGSANQITSHATTQNSLIPTTAYIHSLPTPHTHTHIHTGEQENTHRQSLNYHAVFILNHCVHLRDYGSSPKYSDNNSNNPSSVCGLYYNIHPTKLSSK